MRKISKELREEVYNKFGGLCAYTGTPLEPDWQIDHIEPQFLFNLGYRVGNKDDISNLVPVQRIVNHYKRACDLNTFRNWLLGDLHKRLQKLPKNPKADKSLKHKEYLLKVATLFNITPEKPFNKVFYFETINNI